MESGRSLQETLRARGWHDVADELLLAEAFPDIVGVNIPNGLALELPLLSTSAVSTLFSIDAQDFRWVSIQIIAQGTTSTVVFEQSNDNATWVPLLLSPTGGGPVPSTTLTGIFAGPVAGRFVRARVTGISALTTTITAEFWYSPQTSYPTVSVGGVANGATDDGSGSVKVGGLVNQGTPAAKSTGTRADMWVNAQGSPVVAIGTASAIGDADPDASTASVWTSSGVAVGGRLASRPWLFNGTTWDKSRVVTKVIDIPSTAVVAGTPVNIWTPAAGKKFRLIGWGLSLSVAGSVMLVDNAVGVFVPGGRTPLMAAGVGLVSALMGHGFLSAAANNILKADVSVAGNIQGFVYGVEE